MAQLEITQEHPPQREPIAGELISLTWPIALSMLSYSLMTAVDTLFVGRLGAEAISAVGLGGLCSFTVLTFAMGLLRGGKILTAQAVGAKRLHEVRLIAGATLGVALSGAVLTWLLTLAMVPFVGHLFHEARANELLSEYVLARAYGIPLFLLATALREVSQGEGDSRGPMWAALVGNLVNIPFNALFVLGLRGGVVGSAWANVLAQLLDFAVLAWLRRDFIRAMFDVGVSRILRVAAIGWPLGWEMFLDVSAFSMLGFILARLGTTEMAAHQIALQISHLSILPILALGESVSVLTGNAVGAKRGLRVPQIVRVGLGLGLLYAGTTSAVLLLCPNLIVSLFTRAASVQRLAALLLTVVAGFQLGFVFYGICRAALRGLGDLKFTSKVTVGAAWVFTPPLGYLFGHTLGFGVAGGWCALAIEITFASALYVIRLERRDYGSESVLLSSLFETAPKATTGDSEPAQMAEFWPDAGASADVPPST